MSQSTWYQKRDTKADHLVYLDKAAKELEKLINGEKSMIIRGAAGRKSPWGGRVKTGDHLYFVETGGNLTVRYTTIVKQVIETDKMTEEESIQFVMNYQSQLHLSSDQIKRWAGKKFLCLIEVDRLDPIPPFVYRREANMDDWIITDDIKTLMAE